MLFRSLWTTCLLASSAQALFFYLDGTEPKCFYEELPKDTLVVGTFHSSNQQTRCANTIAGTYKAEAYNTNTNSYHTTSDLAIQVTVDETFDNDHRVVSQTSTSSDTVSKFTFSAADSGLHRLCFTPSGPGAISLQGWFSGHDSAKGGIKLMLDMAIGESSKIESEDKGKIDSIVQKVRELNGRLADIRREQVFQRVSARIVHCVRYGRLLTWLCYRNEKLNFETSLKRQTRKL